MVERFESGVVQPKLDVMERTLEPGESLPDGRISFVTLNNGPGKSQAPPRVPEMDRVAAERRELLKEHYPLIVGEFATRKLIDHKTKRRLVAQADPGMSPSVNAKKLKTINPSGDVYYFHPSHGSKQLTMEDFFSSLDFIPLPSNVQLEVYEQQIFQENHIAGMCVQRVSSAVTKRGWEFARYDTSIPAKENDPTKDEADPERVGLEEWVDNINSIQDFRSIIEMITGFYTVTSNAFIEVIRDDANDPGAKPAGLEPAITSTMRVLKGHRGYVQWLSGRFTWFNLYMPNQEDREAGVALWKEYWTDRGINPDDPEFQDSAWALTLNSAMPEGTWNPHLTEMVHLKDLSLSSKYYGFPNDYRLGKLHALLQWALDYNVALMRNNRIPPFVIIFHGRLNDETEQDIKQYFASLKGPDNWGEIPIIEVPAGSGGPQGGSPSQGMEIVKVAGEQKDGMFMELVELVRKEIAAHYGLPLDLLTTENSNRATIEIAEELFNDNVVNRYHTILEGFLKKITKYDLGCEHWYVKFIDLDTDDTMSKAQEAQIWHDIGVLNPNDIRARYLHLPDREGGDKYWEAGGATAEDMAGQVADAARSAGVHNDPGIMNTAMRAISRASKTNAAGQTGQTTDAKSAGKPAKGKGTAQTATPVAQAAPEVLHELWTYLEDHYRESTPPPERPRAA